MADDRELLVRWIEHLEATPRPTSWLARLRRARAIRRAHAMLEWQASRAEGPSCLEPMRNAQATSFALGWVVLSAAALIRIRHGLTVGRVALVLGSLAIPFGIGIWLWFTRVPKRIWRESERRYALALEQARALPAAPGRPDSQATA